MLDRRRLAPVALAAALLLTGCEGGPSGPGDFLRDLEEAQRLWADLGLQDYVFTYELACFCAGPGQSPARVTVTDGRVTGVLVPAEDRQVPEDELAEYPTIPDLFDDVEAWLDRDPASARTLFDPTFGHPVDVFVDFRADAIDEELGFRVRDLAPMERSEGS